LREKNGAVSPKRVVKDCQVVDRSLSNARLLPYGQEIHNHNQHKVGVIHRVGAIN
jgi:hypothetical protein